MIEKKLLKELKEKLEKEKIEIENLLKEIAQKGKITEDWEAKFPQFNGEASLEREADEIEEYESQRGIEQKLEIRLKNINLALEKIKKGSYGICEKCKKEIEIERLKSIPETKFCEKCKI